MNIFRIRRGILGGLLVGSALLLGGCVAGPLTVLDHSPSHEHIRIYSVSSAAGKAMLEQKLIEFPSLNSYAQRYSGNRMALVMRTTGAGANSDAFIQEYKNVEAELGKELLRKIHVSKQTIIISNG